MRVTLVGYGRMGRAVEDVLLERGHRVATRVDPATTLANAPEDAPHSELDDEQLRDSDAVIEFAHADGIRERIERYAGADTPAVIGTTGWYDSLEEAQRIVEDAGGALLYGANFSVGAYLFAQIARYAAKTAERTGAYDPFLHEIHHRGKRDSPSGTALRLAESLLGDLDSKTRIVTERLDRAPQPEELHVTSTRGGSVPGTHTLYLDSAADTICVTHTARNRGGFALGAVLGAEWLAERSGFFGVEQFLASLTSGR